MKNEKFYEVDVLFTHESEDSKGNVKVKRIKETYLVDAMSVTEAEARIVKHFTGTTLDFNVVGVKSSKIIELIAAKDFYDATKDIKATKEKDTKENES